MAIEPQLILSQKEKKKRLWYLYMTKSHKLLNLFAFHSLYVIPWFTRKNNPQLSLWKHKIFRYNYSNSQFYLQILLIMCLWYVYVSIYCMALLGKSENNFEIEWGHWVWWQSYVPCWAISQPFWLFHWWLDWKQGCRYVSRSLRLRWPWTSKPQGWNGRPQGWLVPGLKGALVWYAGATRSELPQQVYFLHF